MHLQTILFDKNYFNKRQAIAWIKKHNYKEEFNGKKPELIGNFYHFRQDKAKKNKEYRTKYIEAGILFVFYI